jgi:hypothetical protein
MSHEISVIMFSRAKWKVKDLYIGYNETGKEGNVRHLFPAFVWKTQTTRTSEQQIHQQKYLTVCTPEYKSDTLLLSWHSRKESYCYFRGTGFEPWPGSAILKFRDFISVWANAKTQLTSRKLSPTTLRVCHSKSSCSALRNLNTWFRFNVVK